MLARELPRQEAVQRRGWVDFERETTAMTPSRKSLRMLIGEDEPLNAMALQAQVEALGHTVVGVASNGIEVIEMARASSPDLALLDVKMPRMSGLDAARVLYEELGIPAMMLSGMFDDEVVAQARSVPVFHYLVKPVPMEELGTAIHVAWRRFKEREKPTAADSNRPPG